MVEETEALSQILAAARPLESIPRSLLEASGAFISDPVRASLAHPSFDNSVVDGYAIRVEDGGSSRKIIGEQPAGRDRNLHLNFGEAIRIFTGAPIPTGCTGVVMQEDVSVLGDQLMIRESIQPLENIRRTGADLADGQLIANAGDQVTAQLIGLLASQGLDSILVHRPPRVAVLSTGDELRPVGSVLQPGEIYNSNSPMLAALLQSEGVAANCRNIPDDLESTQCAIAEALGLSDVLLISGGVSVGNHDHVRPALAALGITPDFWQIRLKPGKPFAFARSGEKLIFCLPGNPVASFITFLVLARPALLQMMGAPKERLFPRQDTVTLAQSISNRGDRPHYIRGQVQNGKFSPLGLQESHALHGLSRCDALLRVPANCNLVSETDVTVFRC